MKKYKKTVATLTLFSILTFGTVACSKYAEPFNDAPRTRVVNDDPADLIIMPDGFSNAATKCDHGHRMYVIYHGDHAYGAIHVVPNDPSC